MTDEVPDEARVNEIRERLAKATPGPWRWGDWDVTFGSMEREGELDTLEHAPDYSSLERVVRLRETRCMHILRLEDGEISDDDRRFLLFARTDLEYLLSLVDDQRVQVSSLTTDEESRRMEEIALRGLQEGLKERDRIKFDAGLAEAAEMLETDAANYLTTRDECSIGNREWLRFEDKRAQAVDSARRIRSRIGQSSVREAAEGWRDISSAPKNRKVIVGYFNELGKWRSVMATYYTEGTLESPDCDEEGFAPEGWYEESETHDEILPLYHRPTKWMPLPAAPEKEKA